MKFKHALKNILLQAKQQVSIFFCMTKSGSLCSRSSMIADDANFAQLAHVLQKKNTAVEQINRLPELSLCKVTVAIYFLD
jgi:hypothetical protein